ncbi:HAMP domain-containing protein [Pimelobacter simplex]|uniref:adenylate/guanylate cyclase domain-containing protein n=1 Tax=Nocardioides simplex TaxID=2045 RepID=UPI000535BD78|nr:adenylate/guanylate cyclase domain-containing protein [Pimelobacter simplex]MCG8150953.1 HAMP domain-containing protein [Pimelobacter simplex]GEB12414.1 adenylate cyclase [Pimelobacter simplex]SFM95371.1 adenylate cyclase [Pimelobacter simplex]
MPRRSVSPRRSPFGSRILGPRDQHPRQLRIRIQVLLTVLLVGTNLIGALVVFVINTWAIPSPAPNREMVIALAIAIPTYVFVAAAIGAVWGTTTSLRALRWATQPGVDPDRTQRARALRVPLTLTVMQLTMWLVGTVLFTVLTIVLQPSRILGTALTVTIGGMVVAGISYLFTEFSLRPIAARALSDVRVTGRIRGVGVGPRMAIFWTLGTGAPIVGLLIAAVLAVTPGGDDATLGQLAVVTIIVCCIVLLFGFLLTDLNARSVVAPLLSVRDAMRAVEAGHLDTDVVVYDGTELGQLQSGFNDMVAGLREREQIRDLFGRHVGQEVAAAAARLGAGEIELGGETRTCSVLFVDLVGSTTYATEHGPTEVVAVLNRFFGVVVDEVDRHHGLVNKFIGDAVLAIFGAPVELADHAAAALAAARAMAARLAVEVPEVGAGIGVATGQVVAGNVGHEQRFEYTVIGDAVNSAARLTDLAKDVPGGVLASWASVEAAGPDEAAHWRGHGDVVLRGRSAPTLLAVQASASSA